MGVAGHRSLERDARDPRSRRAGGGSRGGDSGGLEHAPANACIDLNSCRRQGSARGLRRVLCRTWFGHAAPFERLSYPLENFGRWSLLFPEHEEGDVFSENLLWVNDVPRVSTDLLKET